MNKRCEATLLTLLIQKHLGCRAHKLRKKNAACHCISKVIFSIKRNEELMFYLFLIYKLSGVIRICFIYPRTGLKAH